MEPGEHGGVLLVDDHEPTRNVMRQLLRAAGVRVVDEAATAAEAIGKLSVPGGPSCVLLDWSIPGDGAREVLTFVRERRLSTHVLVLAAGHERDRAAIAACRPHGILVKPINVVDVLKALRGCGALRGVLPGAA